MKHTQSLYKFYIVYISLSILSLLILFKFALDFYLLNRRNTFYNETGNITNTKYIINPRIQLDTKTFSYITSDRGYVDEANYIFENINMQGDFGMATSKKLLVDFNKNVFTFIDKPDFTFNINNLK